MTYVFLCGLVLLTVVAVLSYLQKRRPAIMRQGLRWLVGGLGILVAGFLLVARRFDLALFVGAAAFAVLRTGRLGPISFDLPSGDKSNISKVQSFRFDMELDHESGVVAGRVRNGQFAGMDLMDVGEADTRILLAEVKGDPDSLSLLESWLDANRSGWREYFAQQDARQNHFEADDAEPLAQAYEVLGLKVGATAEDVRNAHRSLMKALHPDHGGSVYLAAKINGARDLLLQHLH